MRRSLWFWLGLSALMAGLGFVCYQAGRELAGNAALQEAEQLRGERDAMRARYDTTVAGLVQAEQQLRLSQQAYGELSGALAVSNDQIIQMRAELDAIRQTVDGRPRGGVVGKNPK